MKKDGVTIEIKGLAQMLKALKAEPPKCRLGILGDKGAREKGKSTNAEIGAAHEYGAPARGLPQRSFLRMPIADRLQKEMDQAGALSKKEFKEVLKQGSVFPWLEKIAVLAEGIVKDAFDSGGFGKWKALKPGYTNNTGMILVDTTQLRDSVTSEVKK